MAVCGSHSAGIRKPRAAGVAAEADFNAEDFLTTDDTDYTDQPDEPGASASVSSV
jgi:hypothetical protein